MRFPRQSSLFRGPLDPTPVVGVLFLLVIFMLLASLLYTPGVPVAFAGLAGQIQLPTADAASLTGTDNPTVIVAVNSRGQCFFENRPVQEAELKEVLRQRLQEAARASKKLTLVLWADKTAENDVVMRLYRLARDAGVTEFLLAEQPGGFGGSSDHSRQ